MSFYKASEEFRTVVCFVIPKSRKHRPYVRTRITKQTTSYSIYDHVAHHVYQLLPKIPPLSICVETVQKQSLAFNSSCCCLFSTILQTPIQTMAVPSESGTTRNTSVSASKSAPRTKTNVTAKLLLTEIQALIAFAC
jgi:hypothetical protein